MIVALARTGDHSAFEELVRRSQSSIRNLMRRCCNDVVLADDLAQQIFIQVWMKIHTLKKAAAFGGWLKRLAITVWLQHLRKHNVLELAQDIDREPLPSPAHSGSAAMDLDRALALLPDTVRLCVVLSYHEGMSHREIAMLTALVLGTVKSHIKRGTSQLQQLLADYAEPNRAEQSQ